MRSQIPFGSLGGTRPSQVHHLRPRDTRVVRAHQGLQSNVFNVPTTRPCGYKATRQRGYEANYANYEANYANQADYEANYANYEANYANYKANRANYAHYEANYASHANYEANFGKYAN